MDNERTLDRFLDAQEHSYDMALDEIRRGSKRSHWIWYIFPQLEGLGRSPMAAFYGIQGLAEAVAYIRHPVLGARLLEISNALLDLPGSDPVAVMGHIDAVKLRSCMTLFHLAAPEEDVFKRVLDKYFDGELDPLTVDAVDAERR